MNRSSQYTMIALGLAGLAGGFWEASRQAAGSGALPTPHNSLRHSGMGVRYAQPVAPDENSPPEAARNRLLDAPPPAPAAATAGFRNGPDAVQRTEYGEDYILRVYYDGRMEVEMTPGFSEGSRLGESGGVAFSTTGGQPVRDAGRAEEKGNSELADLMPSREELEWRALKVEQEANHELKNLLRVLDLTEEEQDRVFEALAHRSHYYHPALVIGSEMEIAPVEMPLTEASPEPALPTDHRPASEPSKKETAAAPKPSSPAPQPPAAAPSPERDPVRASLPPDQLEAYEKYLAEREAFWAGIIEEIESQLQEGAAP